MKLTDLSISRLKPTKADAVYYDDDLPGFGLRIREGGSRNYVVRYRLGGQERRHTIGSASVLTLTEARQKARKALVAINEGRDPTAEKADKKVAASLMLSSVARDYLESVEPGMKPRSFLECTRHINKAWKSLHGLAVGAVSRSTVATRLREIAKGSGPVAANRARSTLSAMYAWAIGEGLCETNPVDGTNKADEGKSRDRVLSDAELAAIWNASTDTDYGRIVKLLMLTAQRRDEIASLRWTEIEGETDPALIALPAERTKNSRAHDVPLSAAAMDVLASVVVRNGRDLMFGEGEGGYSGWSRSKERLDQKLGKAVKPWTLHDLRRTVATRMVDIGVQPHVIEAVLNHVSGHKGGVAGIYNRSIYAAEKRAALDLWASHVMVAVAQAKGANVTRLRA